MLACFGKFFFLFSQARLKTRSISLSQISVSETVLLTTVYSLTSNTIDKRRSWISEKVKIEKKSSKAMRVMLSARP